MAKYRFDQIAINSTEKKKPEEDDRLTYLGLEHLDSGSLKVTRYGAEVAPIGDKLIIKGMCFLESDGHIKKRSPLLRLTEFSLLTAWC